MIDDTPPTASSSDDSVAALVRGAAPAGFEPGFTDRVLARLRAEREKTVSFALEKQFRRVVPLLAAASLAMAAYNWWSARGSASSVIDAALNLPSVSVASAYSVTSFDAAGTIPELP